MSQPLTIKWPTLCPNYQTTKWPTLCHNYQTIFLSNVCKKTINKLCNQWWTKLNGWKRSIFSQNLVGCPFDWRVRRNLLASIPSFYAYVTFVAASLDFVDAMVVMHMSLSFHKHYFLWVYSLQLVHLQG